VQPREVQVAGVEIGQVVGPPRRDMVQQIFCEIAMRIDYTNASHRVQEGAVLHITPPDTNAGMDPVPVESVFFDPAATRSADNDLTCLSMP
jgi:hypothetical protein